MPMFKRSLLILLLLAAAAAGFAVHSLTGRTTLPEPDGQAMKAQTQDVVVYVSGAVQKPGVIKLKEGARARRR